MEDRMSHVVTASQQGIAEAQSELYHQFHDSVFRLAKQMVGPEKASDLTQHIFLQTFRKIDQFVGESQFKTWLYRLAVNECLQHSRRNGSKRAVVPLVERIVRSPAHTDVVEQKELLETALQRLDCELRLIFLLREMEGLTYAEIAAALSISIGTVTSRLRKARQLLRAYLLELGWIE